MGFFSDENAKFSALGPLYVPAYALLLTIGALCMAFENFMLGALLYSAGLLLLVAREHALYLHARHTGKKAHPDFFHSPLLGIIEFVAAGFILPSALSLYLYFFQNYPQDVLILALAGIVATGVKLIAASARQFLTK